MSKSIEDKKAGVIELVIHLHNSGASPEAIVAAVDWYQQAGYPTDVSK
jgi:hypothetical protein